MSYYTRLELTWDDSDRSEGSLMDDQIVSAAEPHVSASDWHPDVLIDVRNSLRGFTNDAVGFNRIASSEIEVLVVNISQAFRDVTFFVRAMGEEFGDIWARRIRDGRIELSFGPFE